MGPILTSQMITKVHGRVRMGLRRASAHGGRLMTALVLIAVCATVQVPLAPLPALGAGPDAILTPPGYNANAVARGDDTSNLVVSLPFSMNWNGTTYTQIYINMNGNCTFGASYNGYNPSTSLAATNRNIMAPLWSDVDTRNTSTGQLTYSSTAPGSIPKVNGRNAFFVNWIDVASYNNQSSPLNSFQLVLVDRSDTGPGNFDFMFNYDQVAWDIATALSTYRARAGWGQAGAGFELPGSGVTAGSASTLLDSSPSATSLVQNSLNADGQLGRYVFEVRGGSQPNLPPDVSVVDRVLEGNMPGAYRGWDGSGDASASDPDGSVVSLTHDCPVRLPLGTTTVNWTATDNRGGTTTRQQTIVVRDTTEPSNPALSSPTHPTGVWSTVNTVSMLAPGATDLCSGIAGLSYAWTRDAPATPDAIPDAATSTPIVVTSTEEIDTQAFPTSGWPSEWTRSNNTYIRLTNTGGRTRGTYAAELWANNNTRRTATFYRDYDLSEYDSATLSFWRQAVGFAGGSDYARAEYSTNGGGTWTSLENLTTSAGWTQSTHTLPVGGTVRVRFGGSVNRTAEYVDWDDISVTGIHNDPNTVMSTSPMTTLADGTWYFTLHAVDNAGNWSAPVSYGPVLIDTAPPVTTSNAPAGWSRTPVTVTLTATDAGVVTATQYAIDGGPWTSYTAPFIVSAEGVTTLTYRSTDAAGHVESPGSAHVRIDLHAPTVPQNPTASATSTTTAAVSWTASTDALSGVDHYRVYRGGSVVATTAATAYTDTGLTPGAMYDYSVSAVDRAGNESARSAVATTTIPAAAIWLTIDTTEIDMGAAGPDQPVVANNALTVTVGGVGPLAYDLSCSAEDFLNDNGGAASPTMAVSALSFAVHGYGVRPRSPLSVTPVLIGHAPGGPFVWNHAYVFDLTFEPPWEAEAGDYSTKITFTAVAD